MAHCCQIQDTTDDTKIIWSTDPDTCQMEFEWKNQLEGWIKQVKSKQL